MTNNNELKLRTGYQKVFVCNPKGTVKIEKRPVYIYFNIKNKLS